MADKLWVLVVLFLLPALVYACAKMATLGVLRGQEQYRRYKRVSPAYKKHCCPKPRESERSEW